MVDKARARTALHKLKKAMMNKCSVRTLRLLVRRLRAHLNWRVVEDHMAQSLLVSAIACDYLPGVTFFLELLWPVESRFSQPSKPFYAFFTALEGACKRSISIAPAEIFLTAGLCLTRFNRQIGVRMDSYRVFPCILPVPHIACPSMHVSLLRMLIAFGADVNYVPPSPFSCAGLYMDNSPSPLEFACGHRNVTASFVEALIAAGAGVNDISVSGHTPLQRVCKWKENINADIVQILITAGCDVNAASCGTEPPLSLCCRSRNPGDALGMVLGASAVDVLFYDGIPDGELWCMERAVHNENSYVLLQLVRYGISAFFFNRNGDTPMHMACCRRYLDKIKILADVSGNLNEVSADEMRALSPLMYLISSGDIRYQERAACLPEACCVLVENGATVSTGHIAHVDSICERSVVLRDVFSPLRRCLVQYRETPLPLFLKCKLVIRQCMEIHISRCDPLLLLRRLPLPVSISKRLLSGYCESLSDYNLPTL